MLPGYNNNIRVSRYPDKQFHVQTEDNGLGAPDLVTQVFLGGQLVAIERTSYRDLLEEGLDDKARDEKLKLRMQTQHKRLLKNLSAGAYEARIRAFEAATGAAGAPPTASDAPVTDGAEAASAPAGGAQDEEASFDDFEIVDAGEELGLADAAELAPAVPASPAAPPSEARAALAPRSDRGDARDALVAAVDAALAEVDGLGAAAAPPPGARREDAPSARVTGAAEPRPPVASVGTAAPVAPRAPVGPRAPVAPPAAMAPTAAEDPAPTPRPLATAALGPRRGPTPTAPTPTAPTPTAPRAPAGAGGAPLGPASRSSPAVPVAARGPGGSGAPAASPLAEPAARTAARTAPGAAPDKTGGAAATGVTRPVSPADTRVDLAPPTAVRRAPGAPRREELAPPSPARAQSEGDRPGRSALGLPDPRLAAERPLGHDENATLLEIDREALMEELRRVLHPSIAPAATTAGAAPATASPPGTGASAPRLGVAGAPSTSPGPARGDEVPTSDLVLPRPAPALPRVPARAADARGRSPLAPATPPPPATTVPNASLPRPSGPALPADTTLPTPVIAPRPSEPPRPGPPRLPRPEPVRLEGPTRPSLVVVERSLDEVIMSYLTGDLPAKPEE